MPNAENEAPSEAPAAHVHAQTYVEEDFYPAMPHGAPAHVRVWCACGMTRYRVHGGPWTPWMPWDDRDGPNPVTSVKGRSDA